MLQKYTVLNKDIDRQEKMQKKSLPHLRKIRLYSKGYYVPIGQYADNGKDIHKLSTPFIYKDDATDVPQDIITEQNYILLQIGLGERRSGLIEMKTGRGKGNLILKLINHFQEATLILVHNQKTLIEMKEKFTKFSNRQPGEWRSKKKNMNEIMITTHTSFKQNVKIFTAKFGVIFYDEADVNVQGPMIEALATVDAEGLFGLTGTPKRQELDLEDLQLIYGPHIKFMGQANNGYNIIPHIVQLKFATSVHSFDGFHDAREQLIHETKRIQKQVDFVKSIRGKLGVSLFLVDRIEECNIYHAAFSKENIPNVIVNGKTKLADDKKNIMQMVEQKGIIIGTSGKVGRGVDIPEVQAVFLFYPTRFEGNVVQAVGRALRSYPGKEKVFLFDRCDSIFRGQIFERRKTYTKEYPDCSIKDMQVEDDSFTSGNY